MNLQVKHPLLAAPASIGGLELKNKIIMAPMGSNFAGEDGHTTCLLYTSPSPRDAHESRMPSSA